MFQAGMALSIGILALIFVIPLSLLGALGCRIFGISLKGSLYDEPGVAGPAMLWRWLARLRGTIRYILVFMAVGYALGL